MLKPKLLGILLLTTTLFACGGQSDSEADGPASPEDTASDVGPAGDSDDTASDEPVGEGDFVITSRSPQPDAEQRALVADIAIEFSTPPMAETVEDDAVFITSSGSRVPVEQRFDRGSRTIVLSPTAPLEPNQEYRVEVTDALMDQNGNHFEGTSWRFTTAGNIGPTSQAIIEACMGDGELEMLSRVNNARTSGYDCRDDYGYMASTEPLAWNCTIASAAKTHSQDMAQYDFFSHTGSDGSSAGNRLTNAGYDWRAWAENIAAGQRSIEQVVNELLDSPGHCVNIMNPQFTEMGSALAVNPDAYYRRYWTQNFGRPRSTR